MKENDAIKSLINGEFDHLLTPEAKSNIDFIGPKELWHNRDMSDDVISDFPAKKTSFPISNPSYERNVVDELDIQTIPLRIMKPINNQNLLRLVKHENRSLLRPVTALTAQKTSKNLLRPTGGDEKEVVPTDVIVIDGTTFAFTDVSKIQIVDVGETDPDQSQDIVESDLSDVEEYYWPDEWNYDIDLDF